MFSRQLELTFFMYFFLGLCFVGRYFGAFVNISVYVDKRWRNMLTTYLLILDCLLQIVIVLQFKYFKGSCMYLEISGVLFNLVALVGIWWLPESPIYLYSMYKFKECRASL